MLQLRHMLALRHVPTIFIRNFSARSEARDALNLKKELYGENFPGKLLNKKLKTPPYMYIAHPEAVAQIDKLIEPFLQQSKCDTALELNSGIGLFTRKLLDREERFKKIILIETLEHFMPQLHELHSMYPERVKVKQGDFVSLWKLEYQDKMDNGTRVADLLQDVPRQAYGDEPNMQIFGAVGSYNFFKHLINSLVFQNSLLSMGRAEMFLLVPPPIYIHLTCVNDIGYMFYRSTSMLFQILFEYRFIGRIPREQFLPTQNEYSLSKGSKLGRVKSINPDFLYLVRIVPRRNLFDLCSAIDLPALWYFVKQNCVSRRNRIIPNLEKWIPGCGPRLIINNKFTKPVHQLFPDEDLQKLPKYSKCCTTMSNQDYFPNINIYTQFGDLSASQMLTLFIQFRSWSEYRESSFLASLENSLLKMETSADESIDVGIAEEDDVSSDIASLEDVTPSAEEELTPPPSTETTRKRKKKPKSKN